jgi:hypothetical protein
MNNEEMRIRGIRAGILSPFQPHLWMPHLKLWVIPIPIMKIMRDTLYTLAKSFPTAGAVRTFPSTNKPHPRI